MSSSDEYIAAEKKRREERDKEVAQVKQFAEALGLKPEIIDKAAKHFTSMIGNRNVPVYGTATPENFCKGLELYQKHGTIFFHWPESPHTYITTLIERHGEEEVEDLMRKIRSSPVYHVTGKRSVTEGNKAKMAHISDEVFHRRDMERGLYDFAEEHGPDTLSNLLDYFTLESIENVSGLIWRPSTTEPGRYTREQLEEFLDRYPVEEEFPLLRVLSDIRTVNLDAFARAYDMRFPLHMIWSLFRKHAQPDPEKAQSLLDLGLHSRLISVIYNKDELIAQYRQAKQEYENEETRRFTLTGKVQGVSCRYHCCETADELAIGKGYAENLEDGSVQIIVKAFPPFLQQYKEFLENFSKKSKLKSEETLEEIPAPINKHAARFFRGTR